MKFDYRTRKRILSIFFFALLIIIYMIQSSPIVQAAGCSKDCTQEHIITNKTCPLCLHEHEELQGLKKALYSICCVTYGDLITPNDPTGGSGGGSMDPLTIASLLEFDTNTTYASFFSMASDLYQQTAMLGCMIVLIYFLLELADMEMDANITYESFLKLAIKTIIGIMAISNGMEIIKWFLSMATAMYREISSSSSTAIAFYTAKTCLYNTCAESDFFKAIGLLFGVIIPWLVVLFCALTIRIMAWTRIMDLTVRIILAPIGMSDMVHNGMNSNGFKYLKKFLASGMQSTAFMATLMAYRGIKSNINNSVSIGFIATIVVSLALITAIKQTGTIASDAVGV